MQTLEETILSVETDSIIPQTQRKSKYVNVHNIRQWTNDIEYNAMSYIFQHFLSVITNFDPLPWSYNTICCSHQRIWIRRCNWKDKSFSPINGRKKITRSGEELMRGVSESDRTFRNIWRWGKYYKVQTNLSTKQIPSLCSKFAQSNI